jgi:YVTN family beta-propeller protein
MRRLAVVLAVPLLAACHLRAQAPATLPPLSGDGDLRVFLQPFPSDAARLSFTISAAAAARSDGTTVPLDVVLPEVSGATVTGQRLLALGRLPPGPYAGITLQFSRARVAGDHGVSDLLPPEEPIRVEVPFRVERERAVVVRLSLQRGQALAQEFQFDGAFSGAALAPEASTVELSGYCSTPALAGLVVFDRRAREVTGIIPTGRQPLGIAVDFSALRAYVALGAEDVVQVLDLVSGEELRRVPLRTGDEPREVALTPDGATLVTVNTGSNSVSFVDTESASVVGTAPTGEDPSGLLLDRGGRRAYVLNRRSASMTVVDVASRAVVSTVPTDPEPLRAQLNRDGTQLYLIARGSAYMKVFSVPALAVVRTVFLGLGAGALLVDPRTDLVYVGRADEGRIQVFDPLSAMPVDSFPVPGPVSYLALDELDNTLVAVLPTRAQLVFVDVTRKRIVGALDVGGEPFQVALVSQRR